MFTMKQVYATIRHPAWDHLRACARGLGGRTNTLQHRESEIIMEFLKAEKQELHLPCQGNQR